MVSDQRKWGARAPNKRTFERGKLIILSRAASLVPESTQSSPQQRWRDSPDPRASFPRLRAELAVTTQRSAQLSPCPARVTLQTSPELTRGEKSTRRGPVPSVLCKNRSHLHQSLTLKLFLYPVQSVMMRGKPNKSAESAGHEVSYVPIHVPIYNCSSSAPFPFVIPNTAA